MERLWAPWRMEFITGHNSGGCFLCDAAGAPEEDFPKHLLLARSERAVAVLNRYPYANGHILVAPLEHIGDLSGVNEETMLDVFRLVAASQKALESVAHPHGFNIGMNVGRAGGAGVVDHLHVHVVPRWEGDVNFMPVFAEVKVIPQALEETYRQLRDAFRKAGR